MECSICYEEISHDAYVTECKHKFHTDCLKKWLQDHHSCPMCRKVVNKTSIFTSNELANQLKFSPVLAHIQTPEETLEEILATFTPIHTPIPIHTHVPIHTYVHVPEFIDNLSIF